MKASKIISTAVASVILAVTFSGCGGGSDIDPRFSGKNREEIEQMYLELYNTYNTLTADYANQSAILSGIQSENVPSAAIGIAGDGTGRYTFYSNDSKIIFPTTFEYPGSEQSPSDGSINIVSGVSIEAGSNWIVKAGTASLDLEHSSGISGTIKVGRQSFLYTDESLKNDVLGPWFRGLPPSTVTYTTININGSNAYGCQAVTPTLIDSENAYLRCGMFANSADASGKGKCVTYIFVYRGDKDPSKDEAIMNLLNSIKIDGASVLVEQ